MARLSYVILLALAVWASGDAAWSADDRRRLSVAFTFVALGDTLFFTRQHASGVAAFVGAQLVFVWRNGQGLPAFVREGRWRAHRVHVAVATVVCAVATTVAATALATFAIVGLSPGLLALGAAYALFLGGSLWVASLTPAVSYLPRRRAWQTVMAMALFFCCDVTVGLGRLLGEAQAGTMRSLTWVFYAPALWLLAASGRRPGASGPPAPPRGAGVA